MATADKLVKYISKISRKTYKKNTETKSFKNIGSFGSIFDFQQFKMKNPLIVSSTDGVGTKVEMANQFRKFNTIGIDLVAMCVNDLLVQGAKPIFFLDYIAINKLELSKTKKILDGIVRGCKEADCALIGGETAEMPATYNKNKFDLAGFAVGLVEKNKLLIKKKIKLNDVILAVPSSGIHSNGFSLVHNILKKKKLHIPFSIKKELIKPTKIYVKELNLINKKNLINGCANITGGGLLNNLIRIIPEKLCFNVDLSNTIMASTDPKLFQQKNIKKFKKISNLVKSNLWSGDCHNYILLINGGVDIVIEENLSCYDVLPLIPIMKSQKILITDWNGKEISFEFDKNLKYQVLACTNKEVQKTLLKYLQ